MTTTCSATAWSISPLPATRFDLHENEPEWNIRTEHEGMFTEMGIKIKALIARKLPGDAAVTWIEPKVLKKRKAAEEAAAAAKEE